MTLASELDLPKMLTRERHRVHLIGVAGSGMSGIAALLLELGHDVSGSDKVKSWEVDRLQRLGLRFRAEHRVEDAQDAELIIYSSAIRETNPIRAAAVAADQPLVRRAEALAAIMAGKRGILVVGMHGKTTTSAMAAHVLREGGVHPSHTGIRAENILWRRAMRATAPFNFSSPSTHSS
jgi:UDP-N-acetylmuramate--alanine ligase